MSRQLLLRAHKTVFGVARYRRWPFRLTMHPARKIQRTNDQETWTCAYCGSKNDISKIHCAMCRRECKANQNVVIEDSATVELTNDAHHAIFQTIASESRVLICKRGKVVSAFGTKDDVANARVLLQRMSAHCEIIWAGEKGVELINKNGQLLATFGADTGSFMFLDFETEEVHICGSLDNVQRGVKKLTEALTKFEVVNVGALRPVVLGPQGHRVKKIALECGTTIKSSHRNQEFIISGHPRQIADAKRMIADLLKETTKVKLGLVGRYLVKRTKAVRELSARGLQIHHVDGTFHLSGNSLEAKVVEEKLHALEKMFLRQIPSFSTPFIGAQPMRGKFNFNFMPKEAMFEYDENNCFVMLSVKKNAKQSLEELRTVIQNRSAILEGVDMKVDIQCEQTMAIYPPGTHLCLFASKEERDEFLDTFDPKDSGVTSFSGEDYIFQLPKKSYVLDLSQRTYLFPFIIGPKGTMIRKIMRDSGALICGENDDSLHFFGEQTHIKIALNMIEEIIKTVDVVKHDGNHRILHPFVSKSETPCELLNDEKYYIMKGPTDAREALKKHIEFVKGQVVDIYVCNVPKEEGASRNVGKIMEPFKKDIVYNTHTSHSGHISIICSKDEHLKGIINLAHELYVKPTILKHKTLEKHHASKLGVNILPVKTLHETVTIFDPITIKSAHNVQMTLESCMGRGQSLIPIYINTSGGELDAILHLINVFESYEVTIATIVQGIAGNEALLLAALGSPGHRYIGKESFAYMELNKMNVNENCDDISIRLKTRLLLEALHEKSEKQYGHFQEIFNDLRNRGEEIWYPTAEELHKCGFFDFVGVPLITKTEKGHYVGM